jgi:MFS family permease
MCGIGPHRRSNSLPPRRHDRLRSHERRSVVALLISVFCSSAAAMAQGTVLGKLVYDLTGREIDLGLLGLAEFAPAALLVLLTGAVADRFDRRRVASLASLGEAAVGLGLAWYAGTHPTAVAPIFMMVVGFGVARAFNAPAARSLPADMVEAERLPWLVARFSATWQAALIVGPVTGGFLYAADVRLPFVAVAALLVVSAGAVLFVTVKPRAVTEPHPLVVDEAFVPLEAPRAGVHDAMEGLRFIRKHPVLLGAISLDLFAVLFGGAIALLPAIAKDRLGVGAVGLGWLRAAGGMGAAAVTIGLAVRPIRQRVGRVLLAAVAMFGVWTIVLAVTRSFALAFISMAVLSGADAVSVFVRATLVPLVTPEDKRGRVLAVENVFIGASNELGAFESGVAGQLLGTAGAVGLGGVATLAVAGTWWVLFPALRDVDRFPDATSSSSPSSPLH